MSKTLGSGISVVHVIDSGGFGGGERYLVDLVANASGGMRHAAVIPCPGPLAQGLLQVGAPFEVTTMPAWFSFSVVSRIARMIRARHADIVHSHGYRANIYARAAAVLTGAASVCTVHVSLYDYVDTPWWKKGLYMAVERATSPLSNRFICISSAMAKDADRLGIPGQKVAVITNGVDLKRFTPKDRNISMMRRLGISGNGPVVGTVGRMVTEKGQVYLIDALPELVKKFPNLTCLFVGDGPLLSFLRQRAVDHGVLDVCVFAGTHGRIEDVYSVMDVFVLPSLCEPFGLVLLEAMACGVPVVATNSGGPPDFIASGKNGVLVPPADPGALAGAVAKLLESPDMRGKLSVAALKTVCDEFDIRGTVSNIEGVYRSMMQHFPSERQ